MTRTDCGRRRLGSRPLIRMPPFISVYWFICEQQFPDWSGLAPNLRLRLSHKTAVIWLHYIINHSASP